MEPNPIFEQCFEFLKKVPNPESKGFKNLKPAPEEHSSKESLELGSPIVIVISHVCATPSLDPRKWWLSSLHVTWPYQMRVSSSWNSSFNNTAIPNCGTNHGWFQTLESLLPWLATSTQIPKNRRLSRDAMPTLLLLPVRDKSRVRELHSAYILLWLLAISLC